MFQRAIKSIFLMLLFCFYFIEFLWAQSNLYLFSFNIFSQYNDNIYLTDSDKEDDLISNLAMIFSADRNTKISSASFLYSFSRVFYFQNSDYNIFRHDLSFSYDRSLRKNLSISFDGRYYRTEESIEPSENVFRERRESREPYYRFDSNFLVSYEYSKDSFIEMGFSVDYLQNEDPSVEDSRIYSEFFSINKDFLIWFFSFRFDFTQREFEIQPPVNTWGTSLDLGYKISSQKRLYLNFSSERTQNIGENSDDYWTYSLSLNYNIDLSKDQMYHFSFGYYFRDIDQSGKENEGYTFLISYSKKFKVSSFSVSGSGGYRYEYGEAQNTGFTEYYLINLTYTYNLSKTSLIETSAFYRTEDFKDRASQGENTYGFSFSMIKEFSPTLQGSFQYLFRKADSDFPESDYVVNIFLFRIDYIFWQSKHFPIKLWSL